MKALILLTLLSIACAGSGLSPNNDDAFVDAAEVVEQTDIAKPARLKAGIAVSTLPAPVGISTAGYGQIKQPDNPISPFCDRFAATRIIHTPPMVKVVAFEKGPERLVIARLDLVAVFGAFLDAVISRLKLDHNIDLDGHLILSCTHTHSGPGRLADHPAIDMAADTFFPEYFDMVIGAISDTVAAAIDSSHDVEIGVAVTSNASAHQDRRCQNPPLCDDTVGILAVRRLEEPTPFALLINYPVHGTILDWQDFTLSRDAPGAIEDKVIEAISNEYGSRAEVLFLQGASGDAAPTEVLPATWIDQLDIPDEWTYLEVLGTNVASSVTESIKTITWLKDPDIAVQSVRLLITRNSLGYFGDDFPYEHGAIYCGFGQGRCFDGSEPAPVMDCLPLPEDPMVHQSVVSVARIGPVIMATLPGEPHAEVGLELRKRITEMMPSAIVFILGYSQAYLGYIMFESDWRNGGYEASMAIWGWRFADHVISSLTALLHMLDDGSYRFPYPKALAVSPSYPVYIPRNPVVSEVGPKFVHSPSSLKIGETIVVEFAGGDPWLGTPLVILERYLGGDFSPYQIVPGVSLDSLGPYITLDLNVDPPWSSPSASRGFSWTARIPTTREIPTPGFPISGQFRVHIVGRVLLHGQSEPTTFTLISEPFYIE